MTTFDTVVYFLSSSSTGSCPDGPSGTSIVPNLSCTSFFDFQLRWQPQKLNTSRLLFYSIVLVGKRKFIIWGWNTGKDTILWGNGGVPPHSPSPYSLYNFAAPHQTDSRVGEVGEISIYTIVRKKNDYILRYSSLFFFYYRFMSRRSLWYRYSPKPLVY